MGSLAGGAKHILQQSLRRLGFRLQRYSVATVAEAQIQALLVHKQIDLVLDVGANAGQYAQALRDSGYRGRILSFEPLSDAWRACVANARGDEAWSVAPRMALGASEGEIELHVANNSASSSILPMGAAHRRAAPQFTYIGSERVPLRRLDRAAAAAIQGAVHPFLKIDAQGYEAQVLEGAAGVLPLITGIQVEMSLTPLYEGSSDFSELLQKIESWGFTPYAILPAFTDVQSGRMLQVDGLFFRET